jgi:hypothetical protein
VAEDPVVGAEDVGDEPDGAAPLVGRDPRIRARRPAAGATAAPPVTRVVLRTAARRRLTREGAAGCEAVTATLPGPVAIWGQPRKATIALPSTNRTAAPASSEPEVPKPARYALVARTVIFIGSGLAALYALTWAFTTSA